MDFSRFTYSKRYKDNKVLFFDFDIRIRTGHNKHTFDDYKSLLYFLENNPDKTLYITQTETYDFYEEDEKLVINLNNYQQFCKNIGQNGKNRAQAYFARKLRSYSEDEKKEIISNSTEKQILERISSFSEDQKKTFIENLENIKDIRFPKTDLKNISNEDFLLAFTEFLNDPNKQRIIVENFYQVQIRILEDHKEFLKANLGKNETFIQDWIDGKIDNQGVLMSLTDQEVAKLKKSRCLIFGLEFISHKREGCAGSKRFDVLTRLSEGKNEYVLIELKSPSSDVFRTAEEKNNNGGMSTEYYLSTDTSRAIPQISDYRIFLENANETQWKTIGLPKGKVSKCLILIGTRKENDPIWEEHFINLRNNLSSSIEIMTYSDLVYKLETTISNLRENL